jgi:ferritin-like metal-binding protein YciE
MEFETMMQTEIQKLYSIEQQTVDALGTMASQAQNGQLREALQQHRQETQGQAGRLEQICSKMGWDPNGETSTVLQSMQSEATQLLSNLSEGPVKDAAIVGAVQKVEHLEIACYGTARTLALQIGDQEAADLLQTTLDEEKRTDALLTQIAESGVNQQAASQSGQASVR